MYKYDYAIETIEFVDAYNPWWTDGEAAFATLPAFHRDVFDDLYADIQRLPQMIAVTGPRRVGKSTLLRQCIRKLIQEHGAAQAKRIVYFTMDDPAAGSGRSPVISANWTRASAGVTTGSALPWVAYRSMVP